MGTREREEPAFEGELAPGLDLGGSRSEAYGQAEMAAEGGGEDDVYERRARRYFNSYAMQFTVSGQMMPPGIWNLPGSGSIPSKDPTAFGPKPPRSARMTAIRALGQNLLATGYLRNTKAANDPNAVFNALVDLEEDMENYGYQNEDTYLADLLQSSGGIGGEQERFQPEPFVKPALQIESEEDVENAIEASVTSLLGRKPTDEELHRVESEFRSREKQAHVGMVASRRAVHGQKQDIARQVHEAEQTGGELPGEVTISAPSYGSAPHPGRLAEEMFEDTDEAKAFHGARLGLHLLDALKGGF